MNPSILEVYNQFIWENKYSQLAHELYNSPPVMFNDLRGRVPDVMDAYRKTGWFDDSHTKKMRDILRRINREIGCLTPEVSKNIEKLHNGAVEAAHQSVVLGGPCYILNKAATAERFATLNSTEENPLAPFFCVADYDIVQNELTHMRTPNMGSGGNLVSIPIPQGYEHSPVSFLPLPDYSWYESAEESIRNEYRPLFKVLDGTARTLMEERLESILSIIRSAYITTGTLGDWAIRILGHLFNVIGHLGLPILPASNLEVREIWCKGMEMLLAEENRDAFLQAHNKATQTILDNGFSTGTGARDDSHVPFFYECSKDACKRARIELRYEKIASKAVLRGKCPNCNEEIEIEVDARSPDLSEHAVFLSPRVDTRQMVIDTSLPIITHVGGPGETAYYAQVIPVARAMKHPFPLFVRYPRVFFNTPWNEDLANTLKEQDLLVLHRSEMFKLIGKVSKFRRKSRFDKMNDAMADLEQFIHTSRIQLNERLSDISKSIEASEGKVDDDTLELKFDLETYLSWVYGQYAEEKHAQESSWAWIEWALNAGLGDLFGPYERAYVPEMKNGGTMFVNFVL